MGQAHNKSNIRASRDEMMHFFMKEVFIKASEAIHQVDTKPKRVTFGLCLT
jgi:hypothetical protein